jgi:hypothetical protein
MKVSSSFFTGVAIYSDGFKNESVNHVSKDWVYHPLNWECGSFKHDFEERCFNSANLAKEFFSELLKPLEANYGNCTKALPEKRYTWICPSHQDPEDVLSLHVNLNTLGFESKSKGTGKCWFNPGVNRWSARYDTEERSFDCEAWHPMGEKNRELDLWNMAFKQSNYANGKIPEYAIDSQFVEFVQNSQKVNEWVREDRHSGSKSAMLKAFAAATESKPAPLSSKSATPSTPCPEPVVCPTPACPKPAPVVCPPTQTPTPCPPCPPTTTNTNCPQTNNGSDFGFWSGVAFGSITALTAAMLGIKLREGKKRSKPNRPPSN